MTGTSFTPVDEHQDHPGDNTPICVLVVDDQPELLATISMLLQALRLDVLTAHDAGSALKVLDEGGRAIDILLSDVVMPGMNGIDLAREVLRRRPCTGIVLMSGYTPPGASIPSSWHFLSKPFTMADLTGVLPMAC